MGQETTVRTLYGTTDWFKIGKGVCQGCMLSPCLFNLYAEYIMRNAGLEEAQAGIKISGRNINNLRYADDTTLMAEDEGRYKTMTPNNRPTYSPGKSQKSFDSYRCLKSAIRAMQEGCCEYIARVIRSEEHTSELQSR